MAKEVWVHLIIRLLSKLHLFAKIALFGIFKSSFFSHVLYTLSSKITFGSAKKPSIFSNKASFERSLLTFAESKYLAQAKMLDKIQLASTTVGG
jgi:hypothetical protein